MNKLVLTAWLTLNGETHHRTINEPIAVYPDPNNPGVMLVHPEEIAKHFNAVLWRLTKHFLDTEAHQAAHTGAAAEEAYARANPGSFDRIEKDGDFEITENRYPDTQPSRYPADQRDALAPRNRDRYAAAQRPTDNRYPDNRPGTGYPGRPRDAENRYPDKATPLDVDIHDAATRDAATRDAAMVNPTPPTPGAMTPSTLAPNTPPSVVVTSDTLKDDSQKFIAPKTKDGFPSA